MRDWEDSEEGRDLERGLRELAAMQQTRPRTPRALWRLVKALFNVEIPCTQICPGHSSPFEAFAHAFFARDPISVWHASRGLGGKSYLLALLALTEQVLLAAEVNVLGGSGLQSERVIEYINGNKSAAGKFWEAPNAPRWLLGSDPTKTKVSLINGGLLTALKASQTSVRGPHPARLRLDECLAGWTRVLTERGWVHIASVSPGDVVCGWDGERFEWAPVTRSFTTGIKPTMVVHLSNGRRVTCTGNHPFLSAKGWVRADGLKVGESLLGLREGVTWVQVIAITEGSTTQVFDLTVPGLRSFIAEGVVVHNCDEMDLDIFDAAMGQTMRANGVAPQTVCSSTWQNPRGTMTEIMERAQKHGWPIFTWCFRETLARPHGWLTQQDVDEKRQVVTTAMWETEYELQEPNPEGRIIDQAAVEDMFDARLGVFAGAPGEEIRIVQPRDGLRFYHGTDWAKTHDWTVIESFWKNPKGPDVLAAFQRTGRRPWPVMIAAHNARVRQYGGGSCHDATGVGGVCHDYLEVDSQGFDFSAAKARADMLTNYIAAIERRDVRAPRIGWMHGEHKYATWDDVYGGRAAKGHLPDTIAAGALAWMARDLEDGREIHIGSA